jgi:hypothetical protein
MRESIRKRWPWLAYYGGLLVALPRLLIGASNAVAGLLGVVALIAVVAGIGAGFLVLDEWRWQIGIAVGIVVLIGLARANYEEVRRRDDEIARVGEEMRKVIAKNQQDFMKTMHRTMHGFAHEALLDATKTGTDEIFVPLRDDPEPSEVAWTAKVDAWDTGNIAMLERYWPDAEVAYYRLDTGVVSEITDWRKRLLTHTQVHIERLFEIVKRKSKYSDQK